MKTEKLFITALQKVSFKAFAIAAYILLFISQRLPMFGINSIELNDVTEGFSISSIAFGMVSKFFDFFGVTTPPEIQLLMIGCIVLLVFGLAALIMSLFGFRLIQVINFCVSAVGTLLSIGFSVLVTLGISSINSSEIGEILEFQPYASIWLPPIFFLIGTLFTYAFAKMPDYALAEGRFFRTIGAALNPKYFLRTFKKDDNTEALFRAKTPLKKKKYVTVSEPKILKKAKKAEKAVKKKKRKKKTEPVTITPPTKKLTALELALAKREHAEALANMQEDEENKALFSKRNAAPDYSKTYSSKNQIQNRKQVKNKRALELAKLKASHAEEIASRNEDLF